MARSEVPSRRARLLTIVVLVATFAAGTASGVGLCNWMAPRPPPAPPPMSAPLPLHELGLSDEQREKTFRIFEQHRPELEAVLRDTFPKVRAINEHGPGAWSAWSVPRSMRARAPSHARSAMSSVHQTE